MSSPRWWYIYKDRCHRLVSVLSNQTVVPGELSCMTCLLDSGLLSYFGSLPPSILLILECSLLCMPRAKKRKKLLASEDHRNIKVSFIF